MRGTAAVCLMLCWVVAPAKAKVLSIEIANIDQCRNLIKEFDDASDAAIRSVVEMDLFKTILVDVWLECRDNRFETASVKFGAAQEMLRTSGEE